MRARMPRSVSGQFDMEVERHEGWFNVAIEYTWIPGDAPSVSGPPDSWDHGCPDEAEIVSVTCMGRPFPLEDSEMRKAESMAEELGGEQWCEMKWGDE